MTKHYRSHFEEQTASQLKKAKIKHRYETKPIMYENFGHPRSYWPDFIIKTPATQVYLEVKGWLRSEDRWKLERVRQANPEIDLRIIFWDASKPIESGKPEVDYGTGLDRWPTVSEWADFHGFRWCERTLPQAWLDEWNTSKREGNE
jgi:hypothetical protein